MQKAVAWPGDCRREHLSFSLGAPLLLALWGQTIQIPFKETRDSPDSCRDNVSVKVKTAPLLLGVSVCSTMRV